MRKKTNKVLRAYSGLLEDKSENQTVIHPIAKITEDGYNTISEWLAKDKENRGDSFDGAVYEKFEQRFFTHALRVEFKKKSQWFLVNDRWEEFLKYLVYKGYLKPEWVTQEVGSYNIANGTTYTILIFVKVPTPEEVINPLLEEALNSPTIPMGEEPNLDTVRAMLESRRAEGQRHKTTEELFAHLEANTDEG